MYAPGTVTTAFLMALPRKASAVSFILTKIMALISSAWYSLPFTDMTGLPSLLMILKGNNLMSFWTVASSNLKERIQKPSSDLEGREGQSSPTGSVPDLDL
jgi:hypothetical protein